MVRSGFLPFSPHYDFVAYRPVKIDGVDYAPGDVIDKSKISERRLMQLYTMRSIAPAGFADSPKPAYLNNGLGKADQLRAEIEREEAEAAKNLKGEGDAQPRSDAEPAAPRGASAAKPSAAVGKKPAQRVGNAKPTAKSAPKRAAARSR